MSSYLVIQLKFLMNFRLYLSHNYKFNSFKSYPISTVSSRDELIRLITEMNHVEWTLHYAFGLYKQLKNFQHFNFQLMHTTLKNVELLKHLKKSKTAPTCFGLQGNHHQRATVST